MVLPVDKLEAALLDLSLEDRAYLAHRLLESLHAAGDFSTVDENDPEYRAMLRQRIDEVDSGAVKPLPADQVFAELLAKYGG